MFYFLIYKFCVFYGKKYLNLLSVECNKIDLGWMFPWLYDFQSSSIHWQIYRLLGPWEVRRALRLEIERELKWKHIG